MEVVNVRHCVLMKLITPSDGKMQPHVHAIMHIEVNIICEEFAAGHTRASESLRFSAQMLNT